MKASPTIEHALQELLRSASLPASRAGDVTFAGSDPVYRTRYKVATGGAAALGALAIAMADIRATLTGRRPAIAIDVGAATASLRSNRYVRIDGQAPLRHEDVSGFYRAAHGRWNYFHCHHAPHQAALLKVLAVPADKTKIATAAAGWDAFALEDAVDKAGGLAPAVRTAEEWRALPNTAMLDAEPLVDIRKIGASAPLPLPLPPGAPHALSGLRVLDLTRVLAGPTCARLLAEHGADVLKIGCERHPDTPAFELDTGYAKRQATLDLATPAGKAQLAELMRTCDVFSQAYRPGALARLGFGPDQAMAIRPGIIYASLNAFGCTGAWRGRRGFDTVVQAASGMAHIAGRGGEPKLTPVSALDYMAGYLMAFGVLAALKRRHDEGGSYAVHVSLARCQAWLASMGLHDSGTADACADELPDIARWMVAVDTPPGKLERLRPVILYSEESMNELPPWPGCGQAGAAWSSP